MHNGTQKNWVIIKGSHLLWSKNKIQIDDDKQIEQRRRFDGWINVMNIWDITRWKGTPKKNKRNNENKDKHSFAVNIAGTSRAQVWTTTSLQQRDEWVAEIKSHYKHLTSRLDEEYLKEKRYSFSF